ncbi:MAG: methyltransferase domain-containing protein [Bryobacteraceae bacterium]
MDKTSAFHAAYREGQPLFGTVPTVELFRAIDQTNLQPCRALDVGCGDGRDTIELVSRGFEVTAVDVSSAAIASLSSRLKSSASRGTIVPVVADVVQWEPTGEFGIVTAVTLLDHLEEDLSHRIAQKLVMSLASGGLGFFQVLTIDDPAVTNSGSRSEFAGEIRHYFGHNELLELLKPWFRVIYYEERMEWDHDHGTPHQHGMALFAGLKKTTRSL